MHNLILGSYTRRASEGIYAIQLDTTTSTLKDLNLRIKEGSPTYLDTTHPDFLFTVTSVGNQGGVASYKKELDGTYTFINHVLEEGASPCYLAIDHERHLVYGANYHKGVVTTYAFDASGNLTLTDRIQHIGHGPHDNQNGPHAHYSDLTPDQRLAVCDLGNDTVYTYDVDNHGKLTEAATYRAKPGTGPRHLVFHPNGQTAYLFGELSSDVIVLAYDPVTGSFETKQTISTLPDDFSDFNGGAAIRISEDGRSLYASNRGHNSLAVYQIAESDDSLTLEQLIHVEGDFPRDFNLSPDQAYVVVANQNTDNLTLFSRDLENGRLTLLQKDIYAPEVVCVSFTS